MEVDKVGECVVVMLVMIMKMEFLWSEGVMIMLLMMRILMTKTMRRLFQCTLGTSLLERKS